MAGRLLPALRPAPRQVRVPRPTTHAEVFGVTRGGRVCGGAVAPGGWRSCSLLVISALGTSSFSLLLRPSGPGAVRLPGSSTERQLPKRPVYSGSRLLRPFPASPTLAWARSSGVPPVLGSPKVTLSFRPVNTVYSSLFPLKRFGDAPPPPPPHNDRGTTTEAPSLASDCGFGGWTSYGRLDKV